MRKRPEILNTETLARTRVFHIEQVDLRFTNGVEVRYERLVGSPRGAVVIVPMQDQDTVLLVREYAAGVHRYELGLPKGSIDGGESPLEAANRELMEEIGLAARRLRHVTTLTVAPGYLSHQSHLVLAQDLYEQHRTGDEPEEIEIVPWRLDDLSELLQHEECTEARTIAALYMVRDLLKAEG